MHRLPPIPAPMARMTPFLLLFTAILLLSCKPVRATDDSRPPNVVILFCDDAGYGDFSFTGHPTIATPNLERMRREGMWFPQFYSASSACTASRYALLTGRHPRRSGFSWVLGPESFRYLNPQESTLPEILQGQGYATAMYGKWHLGYPNEKNHFTTNALPLAHGFDSWFGLPYSNDMLPPRWPELHLLEGPKEQQDESLPFPGYQSISVDPDQKYLTLQYTQKAEQFIRMNHHRSFFLYVAYAMPHIPLHPGPEFQGSSLRGEYGDVMEEIDWSVGRILQRLRELDLHEQTLVLFTSDNGPWIIKGLRGGSSGLFKDGKGSTWEGGHRVPGIAWWPGTIPEGSVCPGYTSTLDFLPTIASLAGSAPPADRWLDGSDLSGLLQEEQTSFDPKPFFYGGPGDSRIQAVRDGPWKLHIDTNSQTGAHYGWTNVSRANPLLFHLEHDPGEDHNLSADKPEIVRRLLSLIDEFNASVE